MITLRPAHQRGIFDHGWLLARHSFSFAGYVDPAHMGFRALRVINEDTVQPGQGFGTHPHRDMEIITYVLAGALEHRDSTGKHGVLRPGDVQVMSAGTGVTHSEFNHSSREPLRLLQIWILPDRNGHEPRYEERNYPRDERHNRLRLIATGDADRDALRIHQDAHVYAALLDHGREVRAELGPGRHAWVQMARGSVMLEDGRLSAGDGAAISEMHSVTLRGVEDAELLLFDLA